MLVVAVSSAQVQLSRLLSRDAHLTAQDAEQRVRSQMALSEKTARCARIYGGPRGRGHVLDNDGSVDDLRGRVAEAVARLRRGRDGWWRRALWGMPLLAGALAARVVLVNWWCRRRWIREREREKARL